MRRLALLLAVLALPAAAQGRFDRTNSRTPQGRSTRGFPGDSAPFFEFAPANGAGMGTACACAAVTGAKGEALTFTRASVATCTRTASGGLATSGIADGDLVQCASGQPRVEYDGAGTLGLLVEASRQNVLLRSDALTDATWADVGTPTVTNGATDPFNGTTGDTIDDNDGAAFEGRSQSVTVTAAAAYIMSCYLKGGTATAATLSLDGTTCASTGLSTTTWTRATCADASSSGVAISAQVLVGNVAASTGSIIVGGCQVEAGTYATSYIPTVAAAVTRVADDPTFTLSSFTATAPWSAAATATPPAAWATNARVIGAMGPTGLATELFDVYTSGSVSYFSTQVTPGTLAGGATAAGTQARVSVWHDGTNFSGCYAGACTSAARAWTPLASVTTFKPGLYSTANGPLDGIISKVCFQTDDYLRCR